MPSFKKDKKIDIMKVEVQKRDELGQGEKVEIIVYKNIWAYYRQASANEYNSAAAIYDYRVDAIFKISWRDIDNTMIIVFRGQRYGITRIDDFEGYKQDLTIYAHTIKDWQS